MTRRVGLSVATFTLVAAMMCAVISAHGASGAGTIAVTGYIEQGGPASSIDASAHALQTVGVDGLNLDHAGNALTPLEPSALALLRRAHADGLRAEILIGNYDNTIGDFSPGIASRLLLSPTNIRLVTARLASIVRSTGFNGVTVDLESLSSADRAGLVNFVTNLRSKLPVGRSLSVDVSASTSRADYAAQGYDLAALARVVDRVVLMAYDQHGPWSLPGPIGALDWQRRTLSALLSVVSAAKVDLGVAGYGYTWPSGSSVHEGSSVSDLQARRLATNGSARVHWSPTSGEWTATLANGTVLWWSDAHSWRLRVAMALHLHLHGLALWQLASADPLVP